MTIPIGEVEESLARSARELMRKPSSRPDAKLSRGLEFLLRLHWKRSVDGLDLVHWEKRKSRRLRIRGLVDFLSDGDCLLEVFEAELLLAAKGDRVESHTLRVGRLGTEGRRVPHHLKKELLKELDQAGKEWSWAKEFIKDRASAR